MKFATYYIYTLHLVQKCNQDKYILIKPTTSSFFIVFIWMEGSQCWGKLPENLAKKRDHVYFR